MTTCKDCGGHHDTTNPNCGCKSMELAQPNRDSVMTFKLTGPLVPHTCPMCLGRRHVAAGFYGANVDGVWSGSGAGDFEPCQNCEATGVIWR